MYGSNLEGFKSRLIMPALVSRGFVEQGRVLLLFRNWRLTPAGTAEQSRINGDIARARTIPELLSSDPAEAAAIALGIGATVLLVGQLRPHYRQLSEAMRTHAPSSDYYDNGLAHGLMAYGGTACFAPTAVPASSPGDAGHAAGTVAAAGIAGAGITGTGIASLDLGGFEASGFDLGSFDAGAFDALDGAMASFDAGFDASAGGDGGGDGGGGADGGG